MDPTAVAAMGWLRFGYSTWTADGGLHAEDGGMFASPGHGKTRKLFVRIAGKSDEGESSEGVLELWDDCITEPGDEPERRWEFGSLLVTKIQLDITSPEPAARVTLTARTTMREQLVIDLQAYKKTSCSGLEERVAHLQKFVEALRSQGGGSTSRGGESTASAAAASEEAVVLVLEQQWEPLRDFAEYLQGEAHSDSDSEPDPASGGSGRSGGCSIS